MNQPADFCTIEEAIEIASNGTAGFHLSVDMDYLDPSEAPGVGTPIRGGGTYREAHLAMEMISDSGMMLSMEVVEVNPVVDEVNRAAEQLGLRVCGVIRSPIRGAEGNVEFLALYAV